MAHPSVDKHIKRIQSQLTRQNVRLSKNQIRAVYLDLVDSPANPTDEERALVVKKLSQSPEQSSDLTTVAQVPVEAPAAIGSQESRVRSQEENEVTIPTSQAFDTPVEDLLCLQPPELPAENQPQPTEQAALAVPNAQNSIAQPAPSVITQSEVTAAIAQAVQQVGANGNAEAVEMLTSLANELSSEIKDTQQMATALVTAYLGKRQAILSSTIGTLNTLRSAQTESFQAGLDQGFFAAKLQSKHEFLSQINAMFNN